MSREIRRARAEDLDAILEIYSRARAFMAANGNPDQWGDSTPGADVVLSDIECDGYVVTDGGQTVGAFFFEINAHEPAYDFIDGEWLNDARYAVIHRCAVRDNANGVGQFILDWCFGKFDNIRVDTHENNVPMKNLLRKNGFTYCGKVMYNKANGERIAYQKRVS